jgi:hypothetical protein
MRLLYDSLGEKSKINLVGAKIMKPRNRSAPVEGLHRFEKYRINLVPVP